MIDIEIKARHFRCFGEEAQGFDAVYPINVIIGKNNSGKSALLQLVQYITTNLPLLNTLGYNRQSPTVLIKNELSQANIEKVFSASTSGGHLPGNHGTYGAGLIGKKMTIQLQDGNVRSFAPKDNPSIMQDIIEAERQTRGNTLAQNMEIPLKGKMFRMLSAERDINKESFSPIAQENEVLEGSGIGATNLIANFLNNKSLPEEKVEVELLQALQEIYGSDADFTRIQTQVDTGTDKYEIYLEEKKKGDRIALSDSGSSLKTVLLVLLNVILVPAFKGKDMSNYVFAFEELENNLHPALQRRLLSYLMRIARKTKCTFFLTTHSNVVIDVLSHQDDAQILHVKHDGEKSTVESVSTHIEKTHILDDLDFRASDVLQANGVIWVEGPSDRIYLKKWIELWSDGELEEDIHYQFVFYGGSVRKHLSADDPDDVDSAISVFRINRNAVIVMDSDRSKKGQKLESSKTSLIKDLEDVESSTTFVTHGRDIENYINPEVIQTHYSLDDTPRVIDQYETFEDYLDDIETGRGKTFSNNKVLFADRIVDKFEKESLSKMFDVNKKMNEIVDLIKGWNKI